MLNIARQELSTTGEVLAQDGLTSEGTLFVEDGSGTKSGLKLGVSLAEVVDPTTEMGIVNVRYSDRTFAKIRDLKIFSTAIASAQAALAEATSTSISNLEVTVQLLEDDVSSLGENFQQNLVKNQEQIQTIDLTQKDLIEKVQDLTNESISLDGRIRAIEVPTDSPPEIFEFTTDINTFYYTGTISIANANVTGENTSFDTELDIGDVFVATTPDGEEVEFAVTGFDTTNPSTKITVVPTNKTVNAPSRFKKAQDRELRIKVNEIISALRKLKFIV